MIETLDLISFAVIILVAGEAFYYFLLALKEKY